jgi:hypothetical protein
MDHLRLHDGVVARLKDLDAAVVPGPEHLVDAVGDAALVEAAVLP